MDIDILMLLIDVWILVNLYILIGVEGWVTLPGLISIQEDAEFAFSKWIS